MSEGLRTLPIGIQSFESLRQRAYLYVDKTARLQKLITEGERYFLSRPRRFGKSLTLSTLDAMFSGKAELFEGLAAEAWVTEQARHPSPVLRIDMSTMDVRDVARFEKNLVAELTERSRKHGIMLTRSDSDEPGGAFKGMIEGLYDRSGPVIVLIDEYDKPILDKIGDLEAAEAMRGALRSFYTVLKGCDEYLRFVMLTGISRFSKTGVFSAMNNLVDISMDEGYGDVVGYTQAELEDNFSGWLDVTAGKLSVARDELLKRMKDYYDGFCFDGKIRLYNPFSTLSFFFAGEFKNYWYHSGSPRFILAYMRSHGIDDPEAYRHRCVPADFADSQEIERARPESFLYQAGYLTIEEKCENQILTLDYPNEEVRSALTRLYLDQVYRIDGYLTLGAKLWEALSRGRLDEVILLYNTALSGIPYQDFRTQNESLYRSLFLMLLRGAGVVAHGEVPTNRGRSDVLVLFPSRAVVLEFKLAQGAGEIAGLREEGKKQIEEKGYAKPYDEEGRAVTSAVIVIDAEKHEAGL